MDRGAIKFTVPCQAINFRSIDIVFWEDGVAGIEVLEGPIISQLLSIDSVYSALQISDKLSTGKSLPLYSELLLA